MQDVYEIKVQKLLHVVPPIWKAKETPTSVLFEGENKCFILDRYVLFTSYISTRFLITYYICVKR